LQLNKFKEKIIFYSKKKWAVKSAEKIFIEIKKVHKKKELANIFLTGGRTSKLIYKHLKKKLTNYKKKINFFLGDERFTLNKNNTNSYIIKKNLVILNNRHYNFFFFNLKKNIKTSLRIYEKKCPFPDIVLLTLGDDGHIASIFNYSDVPINKKFKFFISNKKNESFSRISMSPNFIKKSRKIFLLVYGKKKITLFKSIIKKKYNKYPVNLIIKQSLCLVQKN
jgi:6-phosphogluconolactonase/glucosamine-6-phosphate isomerase/deaminase